MRLSHAIVRKQIVLYGETPIPTHVHGSMNTSLGAASLGIEAIHLAL
jgi:hypothetical protein